MRIYLIKMDISRTSVSIELWVEEQELRPFSAFSAFTVDDAPRQPPPGDWIWPREGDRIEVKVRRPAP